MADTQRHTPPRREVASIVWRQVAHGICGGEAIYCIARLAGRNVNLYAKGCSSDLNSHSIYPDSLAELVATTEVAFEQRYAVRPRWIAAAPGRVNLIGEHIDYNDGFVLPMAIERYTVIAAAPRIVDNQRLATFYSQEQRERAQIDVADSLQPANQSWSNYITGVIAGFAAKEAEIPGFDALITSSVPVGAGLSSSAALEVATATLLEAILGKPLPLQEKALLCQKAEHNYAGVPCGTMDQFCSTFGQPDELLLLDCKTCETQSVPLCADEVTVLVAHSNVRHKLADGAYAQRRAQCNSALRKLASASWRDVTLLQLQSERNKLSDIEFKRGEHILGEIDRTRSAARAIQRHDWPTTGEMMYASHQSLRDQFDVSCAELDLLVELAKQIGLVGGVFGSRMTGGGFGGCTVSLVEKERAAEIQQLLANQYETATGIAPHLFTSRPARGAHVIRSA